MDHDRPVDQSDIDHRPFDRCGFVKTHEDLTAAVRRMQQQYEKGRTDRDILRGWVLGLPSYPPPHGGAVDALKAWFSIRQGEITQDIRARDIEMLAAVAAAPVARVPGGI